MSAATVVSPPTKKVRGRRPAVHWTEELVADLAQKRMHGVTLSALAEGLGVSRERVRQVLSDYGYSDLSTVAASARREQKDQNEEAARQRIRNLLTENPDLSWAEVAKNVGISRSQVLLIIGDDERSLRNTHSNARRRFTTDDLITALRSAYRHFGKRPLTYARYGTWATEQGAPSAALMTVRFGSWSAALREAGLPANPSRRTPASPRLRNSDLVAWVATFIVETGNCTAAAYARWAQQREGAPSVSLIRHRMGWGEARRRAVRVKNEDRIPAILVPVRSLRRLSA